MRLSYKAISAVVLALSCALMRAQEPMPKMEAPTPHTPEEERVNGEGELPATDLIFAPGASHIDVPPEILISRRRADVQAMNVPVPATHIEWVRVRNQDGTSAYHGYQVNESNASGPAPRRLLSTQELDKIYSTGQTVVNSGDVPSGQNWHAYTADKGDFTVVHEKGSANSTWDAVSGAVALGDQPLNPQRAVIFNALPHETELRASQREHMRMQIGGSTKAWKDLNDRIAHASDKIQSKVATKKELLDELAHGNADVIVVYAHFDGERLHLPGGSAANHENLSDYSISVDEIAKIDRATNSSPGNGARNRVIVLASCSTARHQGNVDSLAQVLLKHGIARTVFATDQPYDANNIPDMMERLQAQAPLRKATGQLRQYVELRRPDGLPQTPLNFEMTMQNFFKGSEIDSGE